MGRMLISERFLISTILATEGADRAAQRVIFFLHELHGEPASALHAACERPRLQRLGENPQPCYVPFVSHRHPLVEPPAFYHTRCISS
jgi:hypothetical protein